MQSWRDSARTRSMFSAARVRWCGSRVPPSARRWPRRRARRIESARGIAEDDRDFLRWRLADLRSRFRAAEFVLGAAVLHGDAHDGNVMRDGNGNVVIFDLENVAIGPPEWDLSLVATYHDSLAWWSAEEYAAY